MHTMRRAKFWYIHDNRETKTYNLRWEIHSHTCPLTHYNIDTTAGDGGCIARAEVTSPEA